jgi:uncharacterized membrane protein YhaH (DUF805 family)
LSDARQNLEEKFRLYNDEELRRLYHSGDLTALAKEVATAELQQRGLDPAIPGVAVTSEAPSKTLIGQAYELPSGRPTPVWWTSLWWGYFALLIANAVLGLLTFMTTDPSVSLGPALLLAAKANLSLQILGIVGLYGYLRSVPLLVPIFWRIVLAIFVAWTLFGASRFTPRALLEAALMLPLIYALWQYAFGSTHEWRNVELFQLLFGFNGRINRANYWLGIVISSVAMLIIFIVFSLAAWIVGDVTLWPLFFVIAAIVCTPLLISFIAVGLKRLHDRDKSGWWLLGFYVLPAILSRIAEAAGTDLQFIFSLASLVLSIWGFVELGCLRGIAGPNKYGSDPLAT